MLNWIKSYLQIEGGLSEEATSLGGVPQGSVIGQLLFLLYTNGLLAVLRDSALPSADDAKMVFP